MAGATEWHNNADEPEVIDYNKNLGTFTTDKPQDLYVNKRIYRTLGVSNRTHALSRCMDLRLLESANGH